MRENCVQMKTSRDCYETQPDDEEEVQETRIKKRALSEEFREKPQTIHPHKCPANTSYALHSPQASVMYQRGEAQIPHQFAQTQNILATSEPFWLFQVDLLVNWQIQDVQLSELHEPRNTTSQHSSKCRQSSCRCISLMVV